MAEDNFARAEIIANGLVQGVGFRYFILQNAKQFGIKGYAQNLYTGEVLTIAEGDRALIEELFKKIKIGPSHASVKNCKINWVTPKNEFNSFEIRH